MHCFTAFVPNAMTHVKDIASSFGSSMVRNSINNIVSAHIFNLPLTHALFYGFCPYPYAWFSDLCAPRYDPC